MSICLVFGRLQFTGEQLYQALAHYGLVNSLLEQLFLDYQVLPSISVSESELFVLLGGSEPSDPPDRAVMPEQSAEIDQFLSERADYYQISVEALKSKAIREIRMRKLKRQFEPHIESEFMRSRSHFDQVEFSLLQTSDPEFATEVLFQVRDDGADFGQIAQRYSQGAERQTQGWVGPIKLSALPEPISVLFRSGEVGQVQGPIEINGQYCIVRLERFHGARLTEMLRSELVNALFSRWLSEQTLQAWQASQSALQLTAGGES